MCRTDRKFLACQITDGVSLCLSSSPQRASWHIYKTLASGKRTANEPCYTVKVNHQPKRATSQSLMERPHLNTMCPTGQLDQAATWLLENAENVAGYPRARTESGSSSHSAPLSGVEVKAESVCICFIDDCLDCDIPLAELTFSSEPHLHNRDRKVNDFET